MNMDEPCAAMRSYHPKKCNIIININIITHTPIIITSIYFLIKNHHLTRKIYFSFPPDLANNTDI